MISSVVIIALCIPLFYFFLKNNNYTSFTCFLGTFLFVFSGPLIYHSHRQLMFVDYMPFLIMSLYGIDRYLNKKKSGLLIISIFLMIMTSYYFSVSGIFVVILYFSYKYLKNNFHFPFKIVCMDFIQLGIRIFISICLSGILILPTFCALLNGRSSQGGKTALSLSLLFPQIKFWDFLYNPYSIGITAFSVLALLYGILFAKRQIKFLSGILITLLLFPIFDFILNGTLYVNAKVFIPFLPLFILVTTQFLEELFRFSISRKKMLILFAILLVMGIIAKKWEYNYLYFLELGALIGTLLAYVRTKKKWILYMPILIICLSGCILVNFSDVLLKDSQEDRELSKNNSNLVTSVLKNDKGFFRTIDEAYPIINVNRVFSLHYYQPTVYSSVYNQAYHKFVFQTLNNEIMFRNIMITGASENIMYLRYMGVKYLTTTGNPPIGYTYVKSNKETALYKNDNVLPLGYATSQIMGENQFSNLKYPYSVEAVLSHAVIPDQIQEKISTEENLKIPSQIQLYDIKSHIQTVNSRGITLKENQGYKITAKTKNSMILKLNENLKGQILFLDFHMKLQNKNTDTGITINGISNKLPCKSWKYQNENHEFHYTISGNGDLNELKITFLPGKYVISGIKAYTLPYESFVKNFSYDSLHIKDEDVHNDEITGTINPKKAEYFVLNIPYDKGFSIYVNGKQTNYEKVNQAFIGFSISKGEKEIRISYHAPGKKEGTIFSIFGIISLLCLLLFEDQKRKRSSI